MKSTEKLKKEEVSDSRYSLDFSKLEKEKNVFNTQSSLKDNRARSAKPLLRKFIPKLKPVKPKLNPSIIYLNGKYEYFNYKKNKNKHDINIVAEEDYEKNANSGDESYSYSYKNIYSDKDNILSCADDDFSNNKENSINNINNNINIILTKKKKYAKNNINHIRKQLLKTKEKMTLIKYNDDTSITAETPYKNYFSENYNYKKCYKKDNNELIFDNSLENDIDFFHKTKSKSIYVGNYKNKNKPPILGFLQMNENSANTTLSSGFSEI